MGRETNYDDACFGGGWCYWPNVEMANNIPGLHRLFYRNRHDHEYEHKDYEAARAWCQGPMIQGRFIARPSGYFYFEDQRDFMAFKLTWG